MKVLKITKVFKKDVVYKTVRQGTSLNCFEHETLKVKSLGQKL